MRASPRLFPTRAGNDEQVLVAVLGCIARRTAVLPLCELEELTIECCPAIGLLSESLIHADHRPECLLVQIDVRLRACRSLGVETLGELERSNAIAEQVADVLLCPPQKW